MKRLLGIVLFRTRAGVQQTCIEMRSIMLHCLRTYRLICAESYLERFHRSTAWQENLVGHCWAALFGIVQHCCYKLETNLENCLTIWPIELDFFATRRQIGQYQAAFDETARFSYTYNPAYRAIRPPHMTGAGCVTKWIRLNFLYVIDWSLNHFVDRPNCRLWWATRGAGKETAAIQ